MRWGATILDSTIDKNYILLYYKGLKLLDIKGWGLTHIKKEERRSRIVLGFPSPLPYISAVRCDRSERNRIRNIGYANDSGGGLVVRADLPPFALVSVFCFCCCCLGRLHEIIRSQCCVRNAFHDPRCTKFFSVGNSFFLPMSETLLSAMLYRCATIALHERGHRK